MRAGVSEEAAGNSTAVETALLLTDGSITGMGSGSWSGLKTGATSSSSAIEDRVGVGLVATLSSSRDGM